MLKLSAPIVSFGRVGEHVNQYRWIHDRVIGSFGKFERATDYRQVWISAQAGGIDFDSEISVVRHTGIVHQSVAKLATKIRSNETVLRSSTRHCEHFTIKELALEFRGAFNFKISRLGQST